MTKLLIVDDEDEKFEKEMRIARRLGFDEGDILLARNLENALRKVHDAPLIDLAVVDIVLRGSDSFDDDGLEVVSALHSVHPQCMTIALTRHRGDLQIGVEAMQRGAKDFIGKWDRTSWEALLENKLAILKALVEDTQRPKSLEPAW